MGKVTTRSGRACLLQGQTCTAHCTSALLSCCLLSSAKRRVARGRLASSKGMQECSARCSLARSKWWDVGEGGGQGTGASSGRRERKGQLTRHAWRGAPHPG